MSNNISYFNFCYKNTTEKFIEKTNNFQKLGLAFADFSWPLYFLFFFIHLLRKYRYNLEPAHIFAVNPLLDSVCIGTAFTVNEQLNIWTDGVEEEMQ